MRCASCARPMARTLGTGGSFWLCSVCGGRAATLGLLEQSLQRAPLARLWQAARGGIGRAGRDCPACARAMREVPLVLEPRESPTGRRGVVDLDVCVGCQVVFFDPGELDALPAAARPAALETPMPSGWKYLLAFFVPVEAIAPVRRTLPLATWAVAICVALLSVLAFGDLQAAVDSWAFVPNRPLRAGGLTLLTSFFLHGGALHLAGNLYFLMTFGDNVEDFVGRARYLTILFGSAVVGTLLHWVVDPGSQVPLIGASGGISGILAFYALRFPEARIGMVVWFRWLLLPAWFYLLFWIGLQVMGAMASAASSVGGGVAYLAHLGGAAAGGLAWWHWGRRA